MGTIKLDPEVWSDYPQHARDKWDMLTDQEQVDYLQETWGVAYRDRDCHPNPYGLHVVDGEESVITARVDYRGMPDLDIIPLKDFITDNWEGIADFLDDCEE